MDDTIIAFENGIDLDACWKKVCCLHIEALDDARTDELLGAIKGQAKWYWSEEEFGVGKPDSSIYLHAVKQLGVTPEEAWMIGDNFEWEVIAPQQIGIKGIWINPKGIDPASFHHIQPYQSINTINDLVHILNGI